MRGCFTVLTREATTIRRFVNYAFVAGLLLGCILLFVGGPDRSWHRFGREAWDLGHVILFSGLAFAIGRWEVTWTPLRKIVVAVIVAALVGLLVEVLQRLVGREFSLFDVAYDVLGAVVGMVLASWRQLRVYSRPAVAALVGVVVVLIAVIFGPVAATGWDSLRAYRQFPVLASFDSPLERGRFFAVGGTDLDIGAGRMAVALTTAVYSGFFLDDAPRNWRNHRRLVVDLINPEAEPLPLSCRNHDREHMASHRFGDRYNRNLAIAPGASRLVIDLDEVEAAPKGRAMAMDQIYEFGCFVHKLERRRQLIVNEIRLE
jgi:VanZ family protein